VAGFVTEMGGRNSHTAILARSLGLPAVLGVAGAREAVTEGDLIVLDAEAGRVRIQPEQGELDRYRQRLRAQVESRIALRKLKSKLARTKDGIAVDLMANIELPEDARDALEAGADGIGLFRTEFLFMNRDRLPDEDEQYEAYARVARAMKGKPVVIRTLDIGADKVLTERARRSLGIAAGAPTVESNPALGLRAIRYCLAEPQIFNTQLRAILRASRHGKVMILIPMLSSWAELNQTLAAVERAKEELKVEGVKYDAFVPVGGMVEIPAAAIALPMFIRKLDFLSIGTNDLIQYTLAIDRADDAVAHLYDPLHPAVLALLVGVIRTAHQHEKPVAVCGEMAGDASLTRLLLGFGLRHFSMHPASLLTVKQRVLTTSLPDIAPHVARMLKSDEPEKLVSLLEKLNA
jgi:phosphotransferase system enzyme I (PtsI)